jgi:2-desacetyl-2-hydroxyethyl bacteriochlorophyllide A dehydrogenase
MRQIQLREPGQFVALESPPPPAAAGEALVRIRRVGVCGSDFHAFNGVHPVYTYPRIIGHEMGCEVVSLPAGTIGLRPGDFCALEPYISCGTCRACRLNRPNCCESLRLFGVHVDGGMQAYLSCPAHLLHKSETLSLDQLALVETLGIGANAVQRVGLQGGESALVVGAGPIGLSVIQFALAAGATVRVIEKSEARRTFAARFGVEALAEPDGQLADVVFDATGNAQVMAQSLQHVAAVGRLVFVGVCRDTVPIDDPLFHKREVTLYASRNSCHQFPRVIGMIERGEIDTKPWINCRLRLRDIPDSFAGLLKRADLIKAMVEVEDADAD